MCTFQVLRQLFKTINCLIATYLLVFTLQGGQDVSPLPLDCEFDA
jgi:hypothetical protein